METKIIKTGFVGSGFAARFHYNALQHVISAKIEIAGVFSVAREEAVAFAAERGGMKVYDSMEQLIEDSDVIHVCTPPVTHEEIVIAALKKNKNVIVCPSNRIMYGMSLWKNLSPDISETEALISVVRTSHARKA